MTPLQIAGVLLIGGTASFWLGAFLPTWKVYVTPDPDVQAQLITDLHRYWVLSHILFLAGAVLTALGLGVFAAAVGPADARLLATAGLVASVAAAIAWAYIVLAIRLSMPPEEYVRSSRAGWAFPTYTVLTLGALMLFGLAMLVGGSPVWLPPVTIALSGVILIAFIIQRDAVPASFYIPSLIAGVALVLEAS